MLFKITLAHDDGDYMDSQYKTRAQLQQAGFTNLRWLSASWRPRGYSLHTWVCNGNSDNLLILKLSADVEDLLYLLFHGETTI
jgi:hypothetical protein